MRQQPTFYRLDRQAANGGRNDRPESGGAAPSMIPLPPGWLCLQDCNLSGQLNQPVVVPFVLINPDVGVALIDVSPATNPEAEIVLRRRLEAARFGSIFPGFLPVLHLRLDRADLPSVEAILRDAFASLPPLSVPGGDGWVSVVRRALLPRDPSRAAAHHAGLPATAAPTPAAPPAASEPARGRRPWRAAKGPAEDAEADMLGGELAARAAGRAPLPDEPEEPASRPVSPLPWIIMSGVGSLIAVLALFGLINAGADKADEAGPPAAPVVAATPMPAPTPTLAPPPPAPAPNPVAALPPPRPAPAPAPVASSPKPPPAAPAPPPAPPPPAAAAQPPPSAPAAASTAGAPAAPAPAQRPAATPAAAERLPRVTVREPSNLRTGPDGQANVVRVVPRGETLRVHNRTTNGWLQVGDDEPRGWLHRSRLGEVVE